jgi:superfamily I DNA/RNA helicase
VRPLLVNLDLLELADQRLNRIKQLAAAFGGDEIVKRRHLVLSGLIADAKLVHLHNLIAKELGHGEDAGGARNNHVILEVKLLRACRKFVARQDRVVCFLGNLILSKLGDVLVFPDVSVLRIVNDLAAGFPFLDDLMHDIGSRRAFLNAPDFVAFKRIFQDIIQFELRALSQLIGSSLLQLSLHVLQLRLQLHLRLKALRPLGIDRGDLVLLKRFPLQVDLVGVRLLERPQLLTRGGKPILQLGLRDSSRGLRGVLCLLGGRELLLHRGLGGPHRLRANAYLAVGRILRCASASVSPTTARLIASRHLSRQTTGGGRGRVASQRAATTAVCEVAYEGFCATIADLAFSRFLREFDAVKELYRSYKRQAALLDFDDLLHHARDLLNSHEAVRRALAGRYPRVLVDEFQDTDPLQAEILWLLTGEGDASIPWHERVIRPGALFMVGDPKQAIYRFRGADVETYLMAKQAVVGRDSAALVQVSANFRSQPPILEFVNAHFVGMLDESKGQPGFTALTAVRSANDESAVAVFGIPVGDAERNDEGELQIDRLRRAEAAVVASVVRRLIGSYPIWDTVQGRFRPARPGDIALLAPTGTSLWIYERELELLDIPIATQAGKGFFRRQEVQDLIAIARTLADRRDTLSLGALLRGPLIGLTEEELADEIDALERTTDRERPLHLWTDPSLISHPVLKQTLATMQSFARKARRTTPYDLLAEAVEKLNVMAILKARHPRSAERALANVELMLDMARAYSVRGISDFAQALRDRWKDGDAQTEGRPDAEEEAVSIITMHSAKGLEWPIVIPINSTTGLRDDMSFLYRRSDDSVHFRMFGFPSPDYVEVRDEEARELERERVRLWYVALTRARDLLLLPRQSERVANDWFGVLELDLKDLPKLDLERLGLSPPQPPKGAVNVQDQVTWRRDSDAIAALQRTIVWHQPSRHEGTALSEGIEDVFVGAETVLATPPVDEEVSIQGGRERGLVLHKLIEEVLTHETADDQASLTARARDLLAQLGLADTDDPALGPCSGEIAASIQRAFQLPEIAALRPTLLPEFRVYAAATSDRTITLTAGIADAVAFDDTGRIDVVIDWKSDTAPTAHVVEGYRAQVRDYLAATHASIALIVFVTSGRIEHVRP